MQLKGICQLSNHLRATLHIGVDQWPRGATESSTQLSASEAGLVPLGYSGSHKTEEGNYRAPTVCPPCARYFINVREVFLFPISLIEH